MSALLIPYEDLNQDTQERIERLGSIQLTPEAKDLLDETETGLVELFNLYANQIYGQVTPDEAFTNDRAILLEEGLCRAVYMLKNGKRIVIETRWNQPVTKILAYDEEVP